MILDKPTEIRKGEEINKESLGSYLNTNIENFSNLESIQQFAGGFSNLTYQINTSEKAYVLRKPPKGAENIKGGHDMQREYNILNAISSSGFKKIPKAMVFCADHAVIGSEFYVMEKLEGSIIRVSEFENQKAFLTESKMNVLSRKLAETLAELHKIDLQKSGLDKIGKPEGYIKRQVEGWYKRYLASETDSIPEIQSVFEWLMAKMPTEIKPSLIHNDFKYDNVIFDLEKEEVLGLLDWEMTTIGDPRMDIGTTLSYWCEAGDDAFEKMFNITWLPGNLTRNEFVDYYGSLNSIDLGDILYFYVFGLFKNAVVIQQIYSRYKKGLTQDPRFKNLIHGVRRLSLKALISFQSGEMK